MRDAVIVDCLRTPVGKAPRGALRNTRPDDLAAIAIRAVLDRYPQTLDLVDDVILGCAMPEGEAGANMARQSALRAGLPDSVPAMTINRFCSSGLQAIALAAGKPFVAVNHLEAHALTPRLTDNIDFPYLLLLVSGGHSQLVAVNGVGDYQRLGSTVDDAVGEAFDKAAKLLGLPYPGGPILSKLAGQGTPGKFKLPRPMKNSGDLMFSFSGLKTAVLTATQKPDFTPGQVPDLAAEFQEAVVEVLCAKSRAALAQTGLSQLVVAGGVGANSRLRERLRRDLGRRGGKVYFPELEYCSDNGAMIAFACAMRVKYDKAVPSEAGSFTIQPRWPLAEIS